MRANGEGGTEDAVSAELTAILRRLGELADGLGAGSAELGEVPDGARIDRIAVLERARAALAAVQHTEMVAFARSQVAQHEAQIASGRLDPRKLGRGIADQIALACGISPTTGSRRLGVARALDVDLPRMRGLLRAGAITEDLAEKIVSETRHLDAAQRRAVDAQLADAGLPDLAVRAAAATARRLAYQADPAGYTARGRTARADRRVTLRPAPDTMSVLSALLPVEQGVACRAALTAATDAVVAGGDPRTRDQILADTLVERLTGQRSATDVDVEVGIVIPVTALTDPDAGTAELVGHGPLPAGIARDVLTGTRGRRWWRRLFTNPANGTSAEDPMVGGDPRRRRFDGFLAHLIDLRDGGRCRDPFCNAEIRHHDHIRRAHTGGPTSFTNGRGVCARGNYAREMPDWNVEVIHDGLGGVPHTVRTTTPTGHTYDSRAAGP